MYQWKTFVQWWAKCWKIPSEGFFCIEILLLQFIAINKIFCVMVSIYLITFNIKQHHYGDEKYSSNIIIENQIFALESVLITMLRVNKQKDIMPHPKLLCYITLLLNSKRWTTFGAFNFYDFPWEQIWIVLLVQQWTMIFVCVYV